MNATELPSADSDAAPALASWETSFELLPPRSRTTMSGMPLVFDPAGTVSSAWVVKATLLPAALIDDSRLGAFPDEVPPVLALAVGLHPCRADVDPLDGVDRRRGAGGRRCQGREEDVGLAVVVVRHEVV